MDLSGEWGRDRSNAGFLFAAAEHLGPMHDRLIGEVMSREPYQSARRAFWIMDNCSAHRGQKAVDRLRSQWPNVVLVHTPVDVSWLNQIEIYFSVVWRKRWA